ncbi:MAG: response regulator transcription factor [Parahaliea sp.]
MTPIKTRTANNCIGILEDEAPQAQMLLEWLREAGYEAFHGASRASFLQQLKNRTADALILDWTLPDCDGLEVLEELRNQHGYSKPILLATARDSEQDIVQALVGGADDYLVKPLRRAEFLARLFAVLRRSSDPLPQVIKVGPMEVDTDNKQVSVDGQRVNLTPTEYRLAECMCSNVGALLSRKYLLNVVWNVTADLDTRTVDIYISRLRRKLKIGPQMGYVLRTVYRLGYRLEKIAE